MKTDAIVPARLQLGEQGIPFAADYGDIYHPQAGALVQARHVFLAGNQLPERWRGRERFTILETGFGLGNSFLAAWQAWRADPDRPARLCFVSVEKHPFTSADLRAVGRDPELQGLATRLADAWPPLTPNLHRLPFDDGKVELLLALGDVQAWLPELVLQADAFFLDGFAPARNPRMWDLRVCKALGRLAAPGATLATWTAARALRVDLTTAGFEVRLAAGTGGKRDITIARHLPRGRPRPAGVDRLRAAPSTDMADMADRADRADRANHRALVVGAGLAGCATAWALADQGWRSQLYERGPRIAGESSGNPAGLFHGTVNRQDGVHARLLRAGALEIRHAVAAAIAEHRVAGATDGLLRLEAEWPLADMQQLLSVLGLPDGYVRAVSTDEAAALSGLPLGLPAWHYPGGGWVEPAGLARSYLERSGTAVGVRTDVEVHALRRPGPNWQLLGASGEVIDEAAVVVLANAGDARRLLGPAYWDAMKVDWRSTRGQVSWLAAADAPAALGACRLPIAGQGYLSPAPGGHWIFGATSQPGDADTTVRAADHLVNLERLRLLTGLPLAELAPAAFAGRTGWRWSTADRLPVIGAVPLQSEAAAAATATAAQRDVRDRRFIVREPGLYLFTGLGSRGIVWSALGARTLAALIAGAPLPIEASLQKAIDPARFLWRSLRHSSRDAGSPGA